jgi:hypothetical protein
LTKVCSTPECGQVPVARGLCTRCYAEQSYQKNKEHRRQLKRDWVARNREKVQRLKRDNNLQRYYGISLETYSLLLAAQGGCCAICGSTHSKRPKMPNLVVDHDHKTGRVRGLLCAPCNSALGMFEDSESVLDSAIHYLRRHRC